MNLKFVAFAPEILVQSEDFTCEDEDYISKSLGQEYKTVASQGEDH